MPVDTLTKLPKAAQAMWKSVFNTSQEKYGEDRATKIAWEATKRRFVQSEGLWVARSEDYQVIKTVSYEFVADEASLVRSEDGFSYIDYVLATSNKASDGFKLGAMALRNFAEKINLEGVVGRIDSDGKHQLWDSLQKKGMSPEEIEDYVSKLETGIKAVKAVYDPTGKVTATLKIANDVVKEALKYKSASAEFRFATDNIYGDEIKNAGLTGFVLTNYPADDSANRVIA